MEKTITGYDLEGKKRAGYIIYLCGDKMGEKNLNDRRVQFFNSKHMTTAYAIVRFNGTVNATTAKRLWKKLCGDKNCTCNEIGMDEKGGFSVYPYYE